MSSLMECIANLGGANETDRLYAAEDLADLNLPEAVPALLGQLPREPSPAVREAIFQALARIDGDAAIEGSARLFSSEDPRIRNQAVVVLRRKGARAVPILIQAMRQGDKDVRKLVLDTLSGLPAEGAAEVYSLALSDPDPNLVITAVENLGRGRAAEFRGRIEDLLQDASHPMLIAACVEALVGIGHAASLQAIRRRFPDWAALPDFLLASCLKAVAALGADREFGEAAGLLAVRGAHLRPAILDALLAISTRCPPASPGDTLLADLRKVAGQEDRALCRYQAVRTLGCWIARDDVCGFLVACLSSEERMVRLAAAESLRLAPRPGLQPVLAARALAEPDEEVLQALSR